MNITLHSTTDRHSQHSWSKTHKFSSNIKYTFQYRKFFAMSAKENWFPLFMPFVIYYMQSQFLSYLLLKLHKLWQLFHNISYEWNWHTIRRLLEKWNSRCPMTKIYWHIINFFSLSLSFFFLLSPFFCSVDNSPNCYAVQKNISSPMKWIFR